MNSKISRHFKRVIAAAIVVTLVAGSAPAQTIAELTNAGITASAEVTSSVLLRSPDVSWEFDSDTGALTLSGTGWADMRNNYSLPYSSVKSLVVEEGITGIVGVGCGNMTSVSLPDTLTYINSSAFAKCYNLKSINIPDSVTEIGGSAFSQCRSLEYVALPNQITVLPSLIFEACNKLSSVTIPDSVTSIESYAFSNCTSLESITIPDSVTAIGDHAFQDCKSLESITIPKNVSSIGSNPFSGAALKSAKILGNPESSHLFDSLDTLESVELSDSIESLGKYMFNNCTALKSITIPNSVKKIGDSAFSSCELLESINIPDSVEEIGENAFANCSGLESAALSKNLTEIKKGLFYNCENLKAIDIPSGVTAISANTDYSYENGSFEGCAALKSVVIPDSVTVIGAKAFKGLTDLTSLEIGKGVEEIGDNAFSGCTSLTSIELPETLTSISGFDDCTGLKSIELPDSIAKIGYYAFKGCAGLTSIELPKELTEIGSYAFNGCEGLTTISIPEKVSSIYSSAFGNCSQLKSVTFEGDDPVFFADSAFGSLTDDVTIAIPKHSRAGQEEFYSDEIYPSDYEGDSNSVNNESFFGQAQVVFKDNGVTYTYVEGVEATCTQDGKYAYYIGSDGKYYRDAYGLDEINDLDDINYSLYGHDEKISWSWIMLSNGEYKAIAKFGCERGDVDEQAVTATVTSEERDDGTITYTAAAKCPFADDMPSWHGEEHKTYYTVPAEKYTVTVEGGSITEASKKDAYRTNDSVTLKADSQQDGKFFVGWYIGDECVSKNPTYTFFVRGDTVVEAKYEEQQKEQEIVASLKLTRESEWIYYYSQKINYLYSWSLPEGCKLVEAGVLRTYDNDISEITPDNAAANGVKVNKSALKTVNGTYSLTVNMKYETKQKTVYAKGYVVYKDAAGAEHTVVTDMQTSKYRDE